MTLTTGRYQSWPERLRSSTKTSHIVCVCVRYLGLLSVCMHVMFAALLAYGSDSLLLGVPCACSSLSASSQVFQ